MRIIVHPGFHKTGSTSFQRNLARAEAQGIMPKNVALFRPEHDGRRFANSSVFAFSAFDNKINRAGQRLGLEGFDEDTFRSQFEAYANRDPECIVISGEAISAISKDGLAKLKECLERYSFRIEIVAIIRPPYSMFNSVVQQRIKEGIYHNFLEIEEWHHAISSNLVKRINNLQDVFGSCCTFCPFAEAVKFQGGLTDYLLDKMNINLKLEDIRDNSSMSNLRTRVQNEVNNLTGNSVENSILFKRLMPSFEDYGSKFLLSKAELEKVRPYMDSLNEKLSSTLDASFTDDIYKHSPDITLQDSLEFAAKIVQWISFQSS